MKTDKVKSNPTDDFFDFPEINTEDLAKEATSDLRVKAPQFKFVGASVAGKGHRNQEGKVVIPCQDSHSYLSFKGWNMIVVCDGAGSYEHSTAGASYCTKMLPVIFQRKMVSNTGFPPTEDQWKEVAMEVLEEVKRGLCEIAEEKNVDYHTLGCTVNLVLFDEHVVLSAHIGDGRAAYKKNNKWEAFIRPFKGDEPGSTVFITSDYAWENPDDCINTKVIISEDSIEAVVLLSDGMEMYSFLCYTKNEEGEVYFDPNEPFAPFLDNNINILKSMYEAEKSEEAINEAWANYLEKGGKLSQEYDDKTMVLAFKL